MAKTVVLLRRINTLYLKLFVSFLTGRRGWKEAEAAG